MGEEIQPKYKAGASVDKISAGSRMKAINYSFFYLPRYSNGNVKLVAFPALSVTVTVII